MAPSDLPVARSRSEQFDEIVLEAMERLERRWEDQLKNVELAVEEVPPAGLSGEFGAAMSLGHCEPPSDGGPARITVYRRPVEFRAPDRTSRVALVHDVVVEQVAKLLRLPPDEVDPDYGVERADGEDPD